MKTLSKLNLNNNPALLNNGDIKYAKNIVATIDQKAIHQENGFDHITTYDETIVGKIEIPNGYVLCLKGVVTDKIVCVDKGITKVISSDYFNFNLPIKGRYTFNSENDLYITLTEGSDISANETRVINITKSPTLLTELDVKKLDLISNVVYPMMQFTVVNTGSILVGTYQLAISYKVEEGIYTNYSILSEVINVFGNLKDHNKIGTSINRSIKIDFNTIDSKYNNFKIGVLYKGEDAFETAYETEDIPTSIGTYNLSNIDSLVSIGIDELTKLTISYIKDEDHVNFNGRLYRTNVKTIDYNGLDDIMSNIASNTLVKLSSVSVSDGFDDNIINQIKYFKEGEQYVLFIGCIDYKGNFVNAYPIPWKTGDETEIAYTDSSHTKSIHKIPYSSDIGLFDKYVVKLNITLPNNISELLGTFNDKISSFCYFYAEHNMNNSKIIGQGFAIRDYSYNDFMNQQLYAGPFKSVTKMRLYSFEHLFNKSSISNVHIYNSKKLHGFLAHDKIVGEDFQYTKIYNTNVVIPDRVKALVNSVKYVDNDNTIDNNIAGDSYHRLTMSSTEINKITGGSATGVIFTSETFDNLINDGSDDTLYPSKNLMALVDIVSNSDYFYNDIYKQKLVIASSIIPKTHTDAVLISGDFFYNNFTIRLTGPSGNYRYGTNNLDLQGENYVFKIMISIGLESRFNIKARYSGNNDYQKVFNFNTTSLPSIKPLFEIPYRYDNFINTSEGKGYSLSCNNNGYDNIVYDKELDLFYNHFNRIVRSVTNSTEAKGIAWRMYNPNDYKDLPIERGHGKLIEADERAVYMQQQYALFVSSVKDEVSNNENNITYLGSSDVFDRDPIEILYDKNGYIGCDNRFGATMTPFGYIIVDSVLKNIFLIKTTQVKKLNDAYVESWFRDNLVSNLTNPYNKQGVSLLYDNNIKSLFLTQQGGGKDFTIHYNFSNEGGWLSFHDYIVEGYISNRLDTFVIRNNGIYKRNAINKCIFFDNIINKSSVIYIFNVQFEIFKQILGVAWDTFIKQNNKVIYDITLSEIMLYNDTQCTGSIDVNKAINWFDTNSGVYKKDKWYFNNISDIVVDDKEPFINDNGELIGTNINNNIDWFKEHIFLSNFVFIKFGFDNKFIDITTKLQYNNHVENTSQLDITLNSYDVNAIKSIR